MQSGLVGRIACMVHVQLLCALVSVCVDFFLRPCPFLFVCFVDLQHAALSLRDRWKEERKGRKKGRTKEG